MNQQDIVQAIIDSSERIGIEAAIFGAIAAIVGGMLAGGLPLLVSWWRGPVLDIEFEDRFIADKDYTEKTAEKSALVHRRYVIVKLTNRGRATATNCRVYLTKIEAVNAGVAKPTYYDGADQLAWPGWRFDARELPPSLRLPVEIVSVDKSNEGWLFMIDAFIPEWESMRTLKGTYRFHLVATADNAKPKSRMIDINYSGDWHHLSATLR